MQYSLCRVVATFVFIKYYCCAFALAVNQLLIEMFRFLCSGWRQLSDVWYMQLLFRLKAYCQIVIFTVRLHVMQCTVLLSQFCLSVHPSVRCVYCHKTKWYTADILISHERAITLVFWHQQWLVRDAPFPVKYSPKVTHPSYEKCRIRQISACNVSTIRDSEKSSIMTNRKSTSELSNESFPTSYRWSEYVTPKPRNGWLKKLLFSLF